MNFLGKSINSFFNSQYLNFANEPIPVEVIPNFFKLIEVVYAFVVSCYCMMFLFFFPTPFDSFFPNIQCVFQIDIQFNFCFLFMNGRVIFISFSPELFYDLYTEKHNKQYAQLMSSLFNKIKAFVGIFTSYLFTNIET